MLEVLVYEFKLRIYHDLFCNSVFDLMLVRLQKILKNIHF